jgi:hypothetical protein
MSLARYRMSTAVSAIVSDGDQRVAISLPAGSIVTVQLTERDLPTGLVEAKCDGKHLMMFAVDLRERAERLKARGT